MKPLWAKLIDKTDPTSSLKHLAYGVVIAFVCIWLTGSLIGNLGVITTEWNFALGLLLGAVTTGKIVGSEPSPAPTAGAVPSTVIESVPPTPLPETESAPRGASV